MTAWSEHLGCPTDDKINIAVVEMNPTYIRASTTLSMANVRTQFSLEENIRISGFTFEVLERFKDKMEIDGNVILG